MLVGHEFRSAFGKACLAVWRLEGAAVLGVSSLEVSEKEGEASKQMTWEGLLLSPKGHCSS